MTTKSYFAVADRLPGERLYSIVFPAFAGVTSAAETLTEVMPQAHDALASAVDDMQADNEPLPPAVEDGGEMPEAPEGATNPIFLLVPVEVRSRSVRVNVSLDEALLAQMDTVAARTGSSRSALLAKGARLAIAAAETVSA